METAEIIRSVQSTERCLSFALKGDLDITTVPSAQEAIVAEAKRSPRETVILDLRELEFMDSAGLALLIYLYKSPIIDGALRVLVSPESQPDRVLKIGRFEKILTIDYAGAAFS